MGPGDLAEILKGLPAETDPRLLVGADQADDAGVFKINDDLALIQTLDFFTPIVDDPFAFGQVAAANALSDVYAMGGRPLTAMNICCFPVKSISKGTLREILRGGQSKVHEAGAVLAGGHSVEDEELKYGLSVTGVVHPSKLVTNAGFKPGQVLILTKPLGTGVIANAHKSNQAPPQALARMEELMSQLNAGAAEVMAQTGVTGATDITGFGLLVHALEVAQASKVGLEIIAGQVPVLAEAKELIAQGASAGGSQVNREFCTASVEFSGKVDSQLLDLLVDAQTSGGMLMALDKDQVAKALKLLEQHSSPGTVIGRAGRGAPGTLTVQF